MKILSIDTSTKTFSLAVSDGEEILRSRNIKLTRVLSSSIIPSIRQILNKAGLSLSRLDGFAVGLGPGSFTSLRVGLSTIKAFALATGKPVVGIPSLDVLALNVREQNARIGTFCDARRNLVYACFYEKKNGVLKRKSDYLLTSPLEALARVKEETILIGDGIRLYRDEIESLNQKAGNRERGKRLLQATEEKRWYPRAECLALLARERFKAGKLDDAASLVPLYLYPEDCQVRNSGK